jgi:hypothetical protein
VGLGTFSSTLRFDNEQEVDIALRTATVSSIWRLDESWTLLAGAGVITDGELKPGHQVTAGGLLVVGVEYAALTGDGFRPFVDLGVALSGSYAGTKYSDTRNKYISNDLRFSGRVGWQLANDIYPYLALRFFGGPVYWTINDQKVTGSDIYHYQGAAGVAVPFGNLNLFGEWAPVGEQAASIGLSFGL